MKVFQQNIFGGEDEVISTIPVIVLKHRNKESCYLAADIEVADFSDPDGDITIDDIQNAFIIVRNDRKKPGQPEIDEVVAHSEAHKNYMHKHYGDKAFISYDVAKWLETYEPVNIDMPVDKFNEAAYMNDWEPVAVI
ncbi:hypothetical protein ACQKNB_01060 [Lysinibacillus xylanilyticus]|uniref:hypothetical protein n=1 Tax=Lysinibacillus xylanilyticus TaxID=582475 RepID=UPI003D03649C